MRTVSERSAGGVLVRRDRPDGTPLCCLIKARGSGRWALPKGHLEASETDAEAAVREVREETGCDGEVRAPLGEVEYTYRRGGKRIHKRVMFFLLEYRGGSTADHDREVLRAEWVPLREAPRRLIYEAERSVAERALALETDGTLRACSR